MGRRLKTLLTDPMGVVRRRMDWLRQVLRYGRLRGYRNEEYWTDRLARHGMGLGGVGCDSLSQQDNSAMYEGARLQFLELCRREGVDFASARMLDIGCGTGFYADVFRRNGGRNYLGIDITDTLHAELQRRFEGFSFRKLDVTRRQLPGEFDLIVMIDVTQHITQDESFAFAMRNIHEHLAAGGVFVVTSWLNGAARRSFFERSRPLSAYQAAFPGLAFSEPLPFRDKFIFAIRKKCVAGRESERP